MGFAAGIGGGGLLAPTDELELAAEYGGGAGLANDDDGGGGGGAFLKALAADGARVTAFGEDEGRARVDSPLFPRCVCTIRAVDTSRLLMLRLSICWRASLCLASYAETTSLGVESSPYFPEAKP